MRNTSGEALIIIYYKIKILSSIVVSKLSMQREA